MLPGCVIKRPLGVLAVRGNPDHPLSGERGKVGQKTDRFTCEKQLAKHMTLQKIS